MRILVIAAVLGVAFGIIGGIAGHFVMGGSLAIPAITGGVVGAITGAVAARLRRAP